MTNDALGKRAVIRAFIASGMTMGVLGTLLLRTGHSQAQVPARPQPIRLAPVAPGAAPAIAPAAGLGPQAFVVSEVTVKKITDTRELSRIKDALSKVSNSDYRLDVQSTKKGLAPMRETTGQLGATNLSELVAARTSVPLDNQAFVVSEVTVKKITDTRELDRIKSALANVSAQNRKLIASSVVRFDPFQGSGLGPQASVVSEVTVKKVVDTKELDRITQTLAATNEGLFRVEAATYDKEGKVTGSVTRGVLPLEEVQVMKELSSGAVVGVGPQAFVVSEVTVKKITDTKELGRIKDALSQVPAASKVVRAQEIKVRQLE